MDSSKVWTTKDVLELVAELYERELFIYDISFHIGTTGFIEGEFRWRARHDKADWKRQEE